MTISNQAGPFSITPLWVLERLVAAKQAEALKLYVALSKWTGGNDRSCHPSRRTLAGYLGVTDRTIDNYVKALIAVGALRVEHRFTDEGDHTSNDYVIVVAPGPETDSRTGHETDSRTGPEKSFAQTRPSIEPDPVEPDNPAVGEAERPPGDRARAIVRAYWDAIKIDTGKPPLLKFMGTVKIVEAAIRAGWEDGEVASALPAIVEAGRPVTGQTMDDYLRGRVRQPRTAATQRNAQNQSVLQRMREMQS